MKLHTLDVLIDMHMKPFKLNLYKGAQVLDFHDETGNTTVKLLILENVNQDEYEDRMFAFYQVNGDNPPPDGARYIATSKGKYWTPFLLFEITGCQLDEQAL